MFAMQQLTGSAHSPSGLASRFVNVAHKWVADGPAERAEAARRKLLDAIGEHEPATLNEVARAAGRGAPAVSRSVDSLVRSGLVKRELGRSTAANQMLRTKLERLAHSELRAVERAIEILERGF